MRHWRPGALSRRDCFFFSSRRRHTRFSRDWSSDVCSSDLSAAVWIRVAPTLVDDEPATLWQRRGRGVFDFHAQRIARPANTAAAFDAVSAALDARPDMILAHRLSSMCVLMALARQAPEKTRRAPLFFDLDDIEHVSWSRRLLHDPGWPAERLQLLHVPRLMLAEIQAIRLAAATFVCSEADRRYLARFPGTERVQTVPNSVEFPRLDDGDATEALVLFVGSMGYRPNIQAV